MQKILSILFSSKTALVLLLIFSISIGGATFVEEKFDTNTAQVLIYKSWWFELTILLMAINFIGHITRFHFFSKGKLGGFIFHAGFIVLILGAAITRYFSFEGTMHIREGETVHTISSNNPYLQVNVRSPKGVFSDYHSLALTSWGSNDFSYKTETGTSNPVKVTFNRYIRNAQEQVKENVPGGTDMIALKMAAEGTSQSVYLKKGERINYGGVMIAFEDSIQPNDVLIYKEAGKLMAKAKAEMIGMSMAGGAPDTTQRGMLVDFRAKNLFQYNQLMFTLIGFYNQAEMDYEKASVEGEGMDLLSVNVAYNGKQQKVNLIGLSEPSDPGVEVSFGDVKVNVKYGARLIEVPFSVKLNDFILDRYAGSMSPSSFASEVSVVDPVNNQQFNKRIFMNHVLDYKGYRFFQSSYDTDEQGTILSVNHDFWGTWISYFSYIILFIGFLLTLFNRSSRYHFLTLSIRKIRQKRKDVLLVLVILFSTFSGMAQHNNDHPVSSVEAEKLGRLLVQTYDGRLEPMHTLAYEVMHKIARKDEFDFSGKGKMDALQVMIDMVADPEYWKQQKMIYIKEKAVSGILGIEGNNAAFIDFLENTGQYKLTDMVEKAFRKSPAQQNRFDKEVIKVDERLNLYYMLLQGSMFKVFPENMQSKKWVDWTDTLARVPLTGTIQLINNDLQLADFNYSNIFRLYLQQLLEGAHSGNYSKADKVLGYIKNIQQSHVDAKNFPSEKKIQMEINYNKSKIFESLNLYYGLISLLLIIFAFTDNVRSKSSKWLKWAQQICMLLFVSAFLYHTYGLILRWYLSGHAPWSNGYEALLLIAWSTVLAGFFFVKSSKIIQAATAFLACIILMTAGHSNYDPQLTNLQPVLKSYWLVIHVAVITISYGFLALGFILGVVNMFLYIFKTKKNMLKINMLISELTLVNEMNLQVGLFLATLGTFLGGVWASESWGRYWGWDAKETWALVIVIVYSIILHLRLVPKFKGFFIFNISSIIGFGSVLMTFIGVNYYLSKGLHSYASDEKTIFPAWGWITIASFILLMVIAGIRNRGMLKHEEHLEQH